MRQRPYPKEYIDTKDIDRFFRVDAANKEMIFIGESLEIRIPKRYEVHNLLEISDIVSTLAVCDLIINDTYTARLLMLAVIEIDPSEINTLMVGNAQYVVLKLNSGDRFMCNTEVVKNSNIVYALFVEFLTYGRLIYNFEYDDLARLFDQAGPMCNSDLGVDNAALEMIYAHLSRSANDLTMPYRLTDMTDGGWFIALRDVAHAPTSTSSKVMGSYQAEGKNAALVNPNKTSYLMEDLLRGYIPE